MAKTKRRLKDLIKARPKPSAPKAGLRINADYEKGGRLSRKKSV